MTVTAKLLARLQATQISNNELGGVFSPRVEKQFNIANGTAAGQADILWAEERIVADGANDDIDLVGNLSDVFGATVNAAEIVGLIVINAPKSGNANTTDLTIGGAAAPFTGFLGGTSPTIGPIKPGGVFMIAADDAAGVGSPAAGVSDILRIANSAGAAATYQIGVLARSA